MKYAALIVLVLLVLALTAEGAPPARAETTPTPGPGPSSSARGFRGLFEPPIVPPTIGERFDVVDPNDPKPFPFWA